LHIFRNRYENKISLHGGTFFAIGTKEKSSSNLYRCIALVITGPTIQTWTTILDEKCNTKDQIEASLKLFKNEVILQRWSIGFMFNNEAREFQKKKEDRMDTIFRTLFPTVPLACCFSSYYEFGKTIVDLANKKSE
jgi:hypothetical protein